MEKTEKILKIKQVIEIVGLSRSSIYYLIKKGDFPRQIKISMRASGWLMSDVNKWIDSRASMRSQAFRSSFHKRTEKNHIPPAFNSSR